MTFATHTATAGGNGSNSSVILTWTAMANAYYGVCVQRTNAGSCETGWWPVQAPAVQVNGLFPGTYYWQVVAITPSGRIDANGGAWSAFTIAAPARSEPSNPTVIGQAKPRKTGGQ